MTSKENRDINEEARLEVQALAGSLVAARALARREAPYGVTTNLDKCPAAAEAYEAERASMLARFDAQAARMGAGMRERIKNAESPEAIAALVRDMLSEGYRAPYVARCLRAVDKRLATLARKGGGK